MKKTLAVTALCSLTAIACGGSDQEAMPDDVMPVHSVQIVEPAEGSTIQGPVVTVRLQTDVPIAIAGDMTPGTGHHHIFLNMDMSAAGEPIPSVPGAIVHMGDGSSEFTFDAVPAGPHRLITVVADGAHVPLQPLVVDTVNFIVE